MIKGFDTITRNVNVLAQSIVVFFYILLILTIIGVGIGRLMYVVLLNGINLFYLEKY